MLTAGFIVIGKPATEYLSINITDSNSDGWVSATVDIRAGCWSGACRASFYQGELSQFAGALEKLHRDLTGTATFTPMESNPELKLTGDGRGLVVAEGRAHDSLSRGNCLTFRLELDQTELPAIIRALRAADPE